MIRNTDKQPGEREQGMWEWVWRNAPLSKHLFMSTNLKALWTLPSGDFIEVSSYGDTQSLTLFSALAKNMRCRAENSKLLVFSHISLHPGAIRNHLMRTKVTFIIQKKTKLLGDLYQEPGSETNIYLLS